ncbi:DEAD/DEAH box helicase [Uruburuella testudinis]|uniref:DEAD/DEAH box helicase n=1 Tax=Uruburuella testudinis TaxID=1282863 RepID=A0ABY4DPJ1_9NEIS|nr:helicase-related protein [Uruburuella testudinis]UOO80972.1 DEAD/DEAH box helicase [Uruburuella testudinis]
MTIPLLNVEYAQTGTSTKQNNMGMREMQARAFAKRQAQYLLLKAPPASGKSRALMFLALDKLNNQGLKKAVIAVPEMSIGGSFADTDLRCFGFFADWRVKPENNLCVSDGLDDKGKVAAFCRFMRGDDEVLVCTHATLRFAFDEIGNAAAFDHTLVAVDEFHHVSADENNRLGGLMDTLMQQSAAHIVAMTGSYFRGDAVPILTEEDEAKFEKVTYTYYEQLNGYQYLKSLGLGYHFYQGRYLDALGEVLDPAKKTIIHIPNVNSGEAAVDKYSAVGHIIDILGEEVGRDEATGIITIKTHAGGYLKIADLVDDHPLVRPKVQAYLRGVKEREDMDIIIALGMAKEGFDWPFCEHVLTIGYRSSMTEVVQIIGRATRDCPGKSHAQFTNLIAQPEAADEDVKVSVNNLLKAITLSLLMEQVLAPNITFRRRSDVGKGEVLPAGTVVVDDTVVPVSAKVVEILNGDSTEIIAALTQDQQAQRGYVNVEMPSETVNEVRLPQIVAHRYPDLNADERQQVSDGILTIMTANSGGGLIDGRSLPENAQIEGERRFVEQGGLFVDIETLSADEQANVQPEKIVREHELPAGAEIVHPKTGEKSIAGNTQFVRLGEKFINIEKLNVDLIRAVNPFAQAYEILSKNVDSALLKAIQNYVDAGRISMSEDEAVMLWPRIKTFVQTNGREPSKNAADIMEKRMAEALIYIRNKKAESLSKGGV